MPYPPALPPPLITPVTPPHRSSVTLQSARHQLLGLLRVASALLHCRRTAGQYLGKGGRLVRGSSILAVFSASKSGGRLICGSPYTREYTVLTGPELYELYHAEKKHIKLTHTRKKWCVSLCQGWYKSRLLIKISFFKSDFFLLSPKTFYMH